MTKPKKIIPPFSSGHLTAICKIIADTETGLSRTEIGQKLADCRIPDVSPSLTKWKRLYDAFVEFQNKEQYGNHVVAFLHKAMDPALYIRNKEHFDHNRSELNTVLAFAGLTLKEDGRIGRTQLVKTISEAQERADRLHAKLVARTIHPDVLIFCKAELLQNNYFHATLEATKSVAEKIRLKTGLQNDGADLARDAFALGKTGVPKLAINPLSTDTQRSEQTGIMNILIGLFGAFRNPSAHAPKVYWPVEEQDALDIMGIISYVHRKLDLIK